MRGIVAHGATVEGGEANRSEGVRACAEAGIVGIEVDVRVFDGELILGHDEPLDFSSVERVAAVLGLFSSFASVMLDIKEPSAARSAAEAVAAASLDNVVFASTRGRDLAVVRSMLPSARVSLSFPRVPSITQDARWIWVAAALLTVARVVLPLLLVWWVVRHRPSQFTLHWATVSRLSVRIAHAFGRPIVVWTVDDPDVARRMIEAGVDGMITNRPLALASVVGAGQARVTITGRAAA